MPAKRVAPYCSRKYIGRILPNGKSGRHCATVQSSAADSPWIEVHIQPMPPCIPDQRGTVAPCHPDRERTGRCPRNQDGCMQPSGPEAAIANPCSNPAGRVPPRHVQGVRSDFACPALGASAPVLPCPALMTAFIMVTSSQRIPWIAHATTCRVHPQFLRGATIRCD
jgi:hypothetical protein